jgi:diguanylate cyclase (GGDEF) domain
MAGNLKIRTLGNWSLGITAVLAILCIAMSILGFRKYEVLQSSTRDYIACEAAAQRFQTGSDTLTRQVRLAAATGEQTYIDAYFEEANVTRSRETALADLSALHGGEDAVTSLEQALSASMDLMQTEYYAMRLVEEAIRTPAAQWPRELLNRRSFDQILSLCEKDRSSFALILADVDVFKQINDTCGHDTGDRILKRVAALLHTTFRSTDYVCRIGGDEFAVIMVDMSRELYYTITNKIAEINGLLAVPEDGLPAVSLSAGVAFSDENGFCGSLFRAADSALYTAKAHGRCGCSVSPAPDETGSKS